MEAEGILTCVFMTECRIIKAKMGTKAQPHLPRSSEIKINVSRRCFKEEFLVGEGARSGRNFPVAFVSNKLGHKVTANISPGKVLLGQIFL